MTVLADRGFGDQKLYAFLCELKFDFVIRFRGCIRVTSATDVARTAEEWLRPDGRLLELRGAGVTANEAPVERVVLVAEDSAAVGIPAEASAAAGRALRLGGRRRAARRTSMRPT